MKRPLSSTIWHGETAASRLARAALLPASWLYACGWTCYEGLYRLGLKRAKAFDQPVICVGNLAVGGTGKTPLAMHIAQVLGELGRPVVLSCSGYGSPASRGAAVAPSGQLSASQWGDEPTMVRWLHPHLPIIVGRDRVAAAKLCQGRFAGAILLLDDGFQHLPLHKNLAILVEPDGSNRACLPAGPYREPLRRLKAMRDGRDPLTAGLVLPGAYTIVRGPMRFVDPIGVTRGAPSGPVSVLCAIGRPAGFLKALSDEGIDVQEARLLADHDPLVKGNLYTGLPPQRPVVVTAKDWVKLRDRADARNREFVVALQDVRVEPETAFRNWLIAKLDETMAKED